MCSSNLLHVLLDTRNISQEIYDEETESYENFLFFLFDPNTYSSRHSLEKALVSKQNALKELYNEIRAELKSLNVIYVYDNLENSDDKVFLKQFIERFIPYEEIIGRILCLFYKAIEEEKNRPNNAFRFKSKIALGIDSVLLSKIKKATTIINDICSALFYNYMEEIKEVGLLKAFLNLAPQDPNEILQRALGFHANFSGLCENTIILVSKDPYEPKGAMCRFWNPRLPIVVFSPFYGNYISSLTLVHELGHLIHYKHHLSMDQTKFEGIYEEFFAFVFELSWLLNNPWHIPRELLQKIFWQRIWFITVRQFQLFCFELLNLKNSSKGIMSLDILKKNWKETSEDILGRMYPQCKWYESSWGQVAQIINLPFRSLDYTIAGLLAFSYIYKKGYLTEAILQAKNTEELLKEMGTSSLEEGIENAISILGSSIPNL